MRKSFVVRVERCGVEAPPARRSAPRSVSYTHLYRVFGPLHFVALIHADCSIDEFFHRAENGIEKSLLAAEYTGDKYTERLGDSDHHQKEETDLEPSIGGHVQNFSGFNSA